MRRRNATPSTTVPPAVFDGYIAHVRQVEHGELLVPDAGTFLYPPAYDNGRLRSADTPADDERRMR